MDLFNQTRFPQTDWLASRDSRGAIRLVKLECEWNDSEHAYTIIRTTGQYNKTQTIQPTIFVRKGKVNRTVTEQTRLQYDHLLKEYEDKGYKKLDKSYDLYSESELSEIVGEHKTSKDGLLKPMLAKQASKVTNKKIFDKEWLASRKIDGVRSLFYFDGKEVRTKSRGGEHYDYSTGHLREHPVLIEIFKKYPTLVLDCELYKHGKSLQQCSGAARLEKNAYDCDWLEMYCYDCVFLDNINMIAKDRIKFLLNLAKEYNLGFDPKKVWKQNELQFQMVPHIKVSSWDNIRKLHDQYVLDDWEGVVIRDPNKPYKPAGRTNSMIKVKDYIDETFKVIGYELGLRGAQDMCFICQLKDGRTFKASPMGTIETKNEYVKNFNEKYKDRLGDCKYFTYSDGGIPCQPHFIGFRYDIKTASK